MHIWKREQKHWPNWVLHCSKVNWLMSILQHHPKWIWSSQQSVMSVIAWRGFNGVWLLTIGGLLNEHYITKGNKDVCFVSYWLFIVYYWLMINQCWFFYVFHENQENLHPQMLPRVIHSGHHHRQFIPNQVTAAHEYRKAPLPNHCEVFCCLMTSTSSPFTEISHQHQCRPNFRMQCALQPKQDRKPNRS